MTADFEQFPNGVSLRADARLNRDRILAAARDAFVERGADVPLEEIAARAGVGIATLYRRFPDRSALQRAVAHDVLTRIAAEARAAIDEEPDAFAALTRYMHRALALQVSAVVPALLGRVDLEDEAFRTIRMESASLLEEMIDRAQLEGAMRPGIAFGDIALLLVRLSRPLPGTLDRERDLEMAQRHLTLLIDGLRTERATGALPGPELTLDDLRSLPTEPAEAQG
ncbi:MAG TPA: helix-turn-helix domain-containing protein [Thermomicrobiales bacterium]|nr:helix-turn-helix domain-containing protein [Thermomicrobiales bacterium]